MIPAGKNNFSRELCPDQYVGKIEYNINNDIWQWKICNISENQNLRINVDYSKRPTGSNYILIVLESPHFDEYDTIMHHAKGPACGSTGILFQKWFLRILNKNTNVLSSLNKTSVYMVVFINSVQYQTSQGIKPLNDSIRDSNWLFFWHNGFNVDLQKRVNFLGINSLVFNMCTYGKSHLHNRVQRCLNTTALQLFEAYHPSCWWRKSRREFW